MKKVLIIGHGLPQPQSTGAGVYMNQLIDLFLEWECEVQFASTAEAPDHGVLIEKSIPYTQIELNSDSFDVFIKELNPEIVVFDRFMTEEQYSWRVKEHCPDAIRVLDTEDLHFLRAHREKTHSMLPPGQLDDIALRELAAIFRSDLSLIISSNEIHYLTNFYGVPASALLHLPFLIKELPKPENLPGFEDREGYCFVGTGMHKPNVDAIKQLSLLWPDIKAGQPEAEIYIYGSYFKDDIKGLHKPKMGFNVVGFVDDLEEKLKSHRLLLAPLRFGAGQKRKVFDAWLSGCPVITTEIGAEGIGADGLFGGGVAEDTEESFVDLAVEYYKSEAKWNKAQQESNQLLESLYSWPIRSRVFSLQVLNRATGRQLYQKQNPVGQILWHHSLQSSKYLSKWIEEKNKK